MQTNVRGFSTVALLIGALIIVVGAGAFFLGKSQRSDVSTGGAIEQNPPQQSTSTTDNAKQELPTQAPATTGQKPASSSGNNQYTNSGYTVPADTIGMTYYTDKSWGFLFWYPKQWSVSVDNSGTYIRLVDAQGKDTGLSINKFHSLDGKIFRAANVCGPAEGCTDVTYYFDATKHAWMIQRGSSASTYADVSQNTMGGLHMLNGNTRFGLATIVPLSARNFLVVGAVPGGLGGGKSSFQDYLAKTIVSLDASIATRASTAVQQKTIAEEQVAYITSQATILATDIHAIGAQSGVMFANQPVLIEGPGGCQSKTLQDCPVIFEIGGKQAQMLPADHVLKFMVPDLTPGRYAAKLTYTNTGLSSGAIYVNVVYPLNVTPTNGKAPLTITARIDACNAKLEWGDATPAWETPYTMGTCGAGTINHPVLPLMHTYQNAGTYVVSFPQNNYNIPQPKVTVTVTN